MALVDLYRTQKNTMVLSHRYHKQRLSDCTLLYFVTCSVQRNAFQTDVIYRNDINTLCCVPEACTVRCVEK
jgi:hypothetical protein